jgi:hypothetical protein
MELPGAANGNSSLLAHDAEAIPVNHVRVTYPLRPANIYQQAKYVLISGCSSSTADPTSCVSVGNLGIRTCRSPPRLLLHGRGAVIDCEIDHSLYAVQEAEGICARQECIFQKNVGDPRAASGT